MKQSLLFKIDYFKNKYINEKKSQNYSYNTINTYLLILEEFYEFLVKYEDKIDLKDINKDIILEFLNKNEKISNSTKKLKFIVLKAFFKYIENNSDNIVFYDKLKDIKIKTSQKEIESLTKEEIDKLLSIFKGNLTSFNKNRDKLLITILIYTGIRASELLDIKFSDILEIDKEIYKILISGKGDKQRYVYIQKDKIIKELNFLKKYNIKYIASTNTARRLTRVGLYNMIKNKMNKAKINKKGVHILRHTFAKSLVSKNVNLSTIKELLGHKNITTTMVYAKSDEKSMINAINLLK